jgi:DeoR/GlpR family transcriptional regulator of sugar metabolism
VATVTVDTDGVGQLRYLDAPERRRRILATLREASFQSVNALATALQVSEMTIRRDLRRLESAGELRIVYGGASLPHGTLQTPGFVARADAHSAAKRRIAAAALGLVRGSTALALDAGTTTYELAVALSNDFTGTVVTHSVPVVQQLLHHPQLRVIALGGELNHDSQAFVGPMTVRALDRLRVDLFFLGSAAVNEHGVYVDRELESPTKLGLMACASEVVLLADASKFHKSAPVLLCPWTHVSRVVTDEPMSPHLKRRLADLGVEVVVASSSARPG